MLKPQFHLLIAAGILLLVLLTVGRGVAANATFDPTLLTDLGMNVGEYQNRPAFANALWNGSDWIQMTNQTRQSSKVYFAGNPQFDTNGYPQYLNSNTKLQISFFSYNANLSPSPSSWPDRSLLAGGHVVVTWKGDADIQDSSGGGTFLASESSGAQTGSLVNGRRVYLFSGSARVSQLTIYTINASNPVTDIKVWLPDPADPNNKSLENQLFHPTFLARLGDASWIFLRFMIWNHSNASPQQDWSDRRLPSFVVQQGILNRRSPATGFPGDRVTGAAYEHMVALANVTGRNMWINIPHLATDDYITKVAQLIRFGSDGVNPYTNIVPNPVYAPLNTNLEVFVEYSNEIWSSGNSFAQGNWAMDQASALGITPGQFNARRFVQAWSLFQNVFTNQTSRVVRVAAVWSSTYGQTYTSQFLKEIATYGSMQTPPQTADIIAPTTYFGNGIQDWAFAKAQQQAGTDDPWFFTTNTFTNTISTNVVVSPVSLPANDPYWTGSNVTRHLNQTFDEWKRLLLSGATQTGGGPDATGIGGGFDWSLRTSISNAFGSLKPIVSYEGGPSIYTDAYDGNDVRDDGITTFMELLNRQPKIAEVYRIHLNQAKAKGLRTHGIFTDVGQWSKYGQWGHLEYADQAPNASVKWCFIRDWPIEIAGLRQVDVPLNAVPQFATPVELPACNFGQTYTQDIIATNGDGALALQPVGQLFVTGLAITNPSGTPSQLRISGTPTSIADNYVFVRANDADGDPAWRTFHFKTVGGPGTILECNFGGTNSSKNLPWTTTYILQNGLTYSGWSKGAGISMVNGTNGLVWGQTMPSSESSSTLSLAISNNAYWQFTLTPPAGQTLELPNAEVRFNICRIDNYSPREYAVFTSVDGFTNGAQVFDTGRFTTTTDTPFYFTLPATTNYSGISNPFTLRIYGYSGQNSGYKTSLTAFKINATPPTNVWINLGTLGN